MSKHGILVIVIALVVLALPGANNGCSCEYSIGDSGKFRVKSVTFVTSATDDTAKEPVYAPGETIFVKYHVENLERLDGEVHYLFEFVVKDASGKELFPPLKLDQKESLVGVGTTFVQGDYSQPLPPGLAPGKYQLAITFGDVLGGKTITRTESFQVEAPAGTPPVKGRKPIEGTPPPAAGQESARLD